MLLTLLEKKDEVKKIIIDSGGEDIYGSYVDSIKGENKTKTLAVRLLHKLFDGMSLQSLISNIQKSKYRDKKEKNLQMLVTLVAEKQQLVESIENGFMRSLRQAFGDKKISKISAFHISKFFLLHPNEKGWQTV